MKVKSIIGQGSRLSLSLINDFIDAHTGKMMVLSHGIGALDNFHLKKIGTQFIVEIPISL